MVAPSPAPAPQPAPADDRDAAAPARWWARPGAAMRGAGLRGLLRRRAAAPETAGVEVPAQPALAVGGWADWDREGKDGDGTPDD